LEGFTPRILVAMRYPGRDVIELSDNSGNAIALLSDPGSIVAAEVYGDGNQPQSMLTFRENVNYKSFNFMTAALADANGVADDGIREEQNPFPELLRVRTDLAQDAVMPLELPGGFEGLGIRVSTETTVIVYFPNGASVDVRYDRGQHLQGAVIMTPSGTDVLQLPRTVGAHFPEDFHQLAGALTQ
jgi:hypothetical protein